MTSIGSIIENYYRILKNKDCIVLINQSSGYLMEDIACAFSKEYGKVVIISSYDMKNAITDRIIAYDKSSSFKRIVTWLVATLQIGWKVVWKYRGSELFIVSNPPLAPLLPLILGNRFKLLIFDIYPDVLVSQQKMKDSSFVIHWWRKANRKVFAKADQVFTISEGMKECLCQYIEKEKIKVVPLWPNSIHIHPIGKGDNLFVRKHRLDGKFVVLYSGNLGSTHRMDVLVDVAQRMEDVMFVIIGEGAKKRLIADRIEKEKCQNVMLLPYQPLETFSHVLSAADLAVVTLDMKASQMSVPSKTFNLMAVGAPVLGIASPNSELGRMVSQYDMGRIFLPDDIDGMVAFIQKMKDDDSLRSLYSKNSLAASRHYTSENAKMFLH